MVMTHHGIHKKSVDALGQMAPGGYRGAWHRAAGEALRRFDAGVAALASLRHAKGGKTPPGRSSTRAIAMGIGQATARVIRLHGRRPRGPSRSASGNHRWIPRSRLPVPACCGRSAEAPPLIEGCMPSVTPKRRAATCELAGRPREPRPGQAARRRIHRSNASSSTASSVVPLRLEEVNVVSPRARHSGVPQPPSTEVQPGWVSLAA